MMSRLILVLAIFFLVPKAFSQPELILEVQLEGLKRTDPEWLLNYIPLHCPCRLGSEDLLAIQEKLLTTQAFQSVTMKMTSHPDDPDAQLLIIMVREKWTTIPVIRGAFGGGTPLMVAGIYDTHVAGQLWTLGGEIQKYGSAEPGWVVWTRLPRWQTGRHFLNLEVWKDRRIRNVYDKTYQVVGEVQTDSTLVRGDMLFPLPHSNHWQIGFKIESRDIAKSSLTIDQPISWTLLQGLETISPDSDRQIATQKTLLSLVYDDISINHLQYHGARFTLASGPTFRGNSAGNYHELEGFLYYQLDSRWNLAAHAYLSSSSDRSLASQQFLGGLESIRGLPDGAIFGTKAGYLNLELRHISWQWTYLDIQNVLFCDIGSASSDWQSFRKDWRASSGIGVRLSIPQVHRLVFRIDYAWSLDEYGASGITAGMYQFFQPYRPL